MTREETKQLILEIRQAYGQLLPPDINGLKGMVDMWQEVMQDIQYQHAHMAVIALMKECDFMPTAAQLYKRATEIAKDEFLANGGVIYG